jgi:lysophospholipase L1-like esterase
VVRTEPRRIRIVALGDSTTARATDWAPEIREVYADCLPRRLQPFGIEAHVDNAGIGDTTTRDALERLDRDVRSRRPDIVIVQFGINDSWIDVDLGSTTPRLTRAEFRSNLRAIIRVLQTDGARVVLMTPNPMRWSDPFYIKAFEPHPELLSIADERGIDRLLEQYANDVREICGASGWRWSMSTGGSNPTAANPGNRSMNCCSREMAFTPIRPARHSCADCWRISS